MDHQLITAFEGKHHSLQKAGPGIETQAQFASGWTVVIKRLDP